MNCFDKIQIEETAEAQMFFNMEEMAFMQEWMEERMREAQQELDEWADARMEETLAGEVDF